MEMSLNKNVYFFFFYTYPWCVCELYCVHGNDFENCVVKWCVKHTDLIEHLMCVMLLPAPGIAWLCCDARRQVRMQALTYLQRALLVHDLQTLDATEWESCFNKVWGRSTRPFCSATNTSVVNELIKCTVDVYVARYFSRCWLSYWTTSAQQMWVVWRRPGWEAAHSCQRLTTTHTAAHTQQQQETTPVHLYLWGAELNVHIKHQNQTAFIIMTALKQLWDVWEQESGHLTGVMESCLRSVD